MKNLLLLFFIIPSLSTYSQKKNTKPKPVNTQFSIEISGKLLDNCRKSSDLYFGEFHGADHDVQAIKVNDKGAFTAKFSLKEPGLVYIKKGMYVKYFLVTAKEKTYNLTLTCSNDALSLLKIDNSPENKAYEDFLSLHKKFTTNSESYRTKNLDDVLVFEEFKKVVRDYQIELANLAKQNPQTYTANYLVVADYISEKDLLSIQSLRQNYLKRLSFSNAKFYNTELPTFIIENYINFISDKNDGSFVPFESLLNLASKNTETAKRLQDLLYDAIFKSKREDLISGYINWAKANPNKLVNIVVSAKLERLAKSMVGGPFINVSLKDTLGNTQELKNVVASSKYTLLILYSPGCSHCQQTLPKLVPIWEQYKSKGFKVFTVAAITPNPEWTDFLKKYTGIGWTNVIEEQNNASFGAYVISTLPSFVLIDSKGKIASKMDAHTVEVDLKKWLDSH